MMNWDYAFPGTQIEDSVKQTFQRLGLLEGCGFDPKLMAYFQKDAFHLDGSPVEQEASILYPVQTAKYYGIAVPEYLAKIEEQYRQTASLAALNWLKSLLGGVPGTDLGNLIIRHGFRLDHIDASGNVTPICFPANLVRHANGEEAAVIAFPDSYENDDSWLGEAIPQYARAQAQFQLWCWRQLHAVNPASPFPKKAYIVRITGNLAVDVTIRTIPSEPAKEDAVANRVLTRYRSCRTSGSAPVLNTFAQMDWREVKQEEFDSAYHMDDEDLRELIRQYLAVRSERKELEREMEKIQADMDAIAIRLGSLTAIDAAKGVLQTDTMEYTVQHTKRRASRTGSISVPLLRQFFPELADRVYVQTTPRGRVSIEVVS